MITAASTVSALRRRYTLINKNPETQNESKDIRGWQQQRDSVVEVHLKKGPSASTNYLVVECSFLCPQICRTQRRRNVTQILDAEELANLDVKYA